MDCRQESCEAEGCGWESRCTQSSLTPTVWVTLSSMWLQDTTVRNTCCSPFLPFDFCPPDASPPVRHSGQLTSHPRCRPCWAAGHNHHLIRTTHTTSLASTAWLDMDADRETHCPGAKRHTEDPRIYPGPSICGTIACALQLAPARETWVNFQKWAFFCVLLQQK